MADKVVMDGSNFVVNSDKGRYNVGWLNFGVNVSVSFRVQKFAVAPENIDVDNVARIAFASAVAG